MRSNEEWDRIARTSAFQELMKKKRNFLVPAVIFFMVFYFLLPILAGFTTMLNGRVIGAITWAWVYAYATLVMTWVLCHLYLSRSNAWDNLIERACHEASETSKTGVRSK